MRSSLNKINGNYMGHGELYNASGIYSTNKHYNRLLGTEWIRPPEWINISDMSGITQGMVGLLAVIPGFTAYGTGWTSNHNFLAFRMQGAYTVDWGDGIVQNFASGAIAGHTYNYYELPETNLTREGYKQVVVTATPQTGSNITLVDIEETYSVTGITQPAPTQCWLQLKFKIPNATSFSSGASRRCPLLKSIEFIGSYSSATAPGFIPGSCVENISISPEFTQNMTTFADAFNSSTTVGTSAPFLKTVPLIDTRKAQSTRLMFFRCRGIRVIPPIDTSKSTDFSGMFRDAESIQEVPFLDTSNAVNVSEMFSNSPCIRYIPPVDFSLVTTMNTCFNGCQSIIELPLLNTQNVTNMNSAFDGMLALKSVPGLSTAKVNTATSMFNNCVRVSMFPFLDLSGVTRGGFAGSVYSGCRSAFRYHGISYNPGYTGINPFGSVTSSLFPRPILLDGIYVGGVSGASFSVMPTSLRVAPVYGAGATLSYVNANMSPTALNEIFTALATLQIGYTATINVSGNWGATTGTFYGVTCDTSIATSKGWIVIR